MDPESEPSRPLPQPATERAPARRLRVPHASWGFLIALLLVAGVGAVAVDGRTRAREDAEIAACRLALTAATDNAEQRLGLVSHYLEPALTSNGRVQELHLADLMAARAGEVLPSVQRAERLCRSTTIEPWHFSQVRRQGAATAYAAALVTLVQTITAQGPTPFRNDEFMERLREAVGVG